ncbi:MAG: hypothetical protein AAF153_02735 [Pseudomonadota bacterium]
MERLDPQRPLHQAPGDTYARGVLTNEGGYWQDIFAKAEPKSELKYAR